MVKNPPAIAGDTSLIPGPGRFYTPQGNSACASRLSPRAHAQQQEKSLQGEAHALQLESSLHLPQLEKARKQQEDPVQPKQTKTPKALRWLTRICMSWPLTRPAPDPSLCSSHTGLLPVPEPAGHALASGYLHRLVILSEMLFPQVLHISIPQLLCTLVQRKPLSKASTLFKNIALGLPW